MLEVREIRLVRGCPSASAFFHGAYLSAPPNENSTIAQCINFISWEKLSGAAEQPRQSCGACVLERQLKKILALFSTAPSLFISDGYQLSGKFGEICRITHTHTHTQTDRKLGCYTHKNHPRFSHVPVFLRSYDRKTPWFRFVPCTALGVLITLAPCAILIPPPQKKAPFLAEKQTRAQPVAPALHSSCAARIQENFPPSRLLQ